MESIRDIIKRQKNRQQFIKKDLENNKLKDRLQELKDNNKIWFGKPSKTPNIPNGYILMKIPENLDDVKIGKLRTLHADIFGKEPPHDKAHGKAWIANKIKAILSK